MLLGGAPIDDQLASPIGRPVGSKLDRALLFRAQVVALVALTRDEKEAILSALEKPPPELEPVREVLMADAQWRLRGRL